LVVIKRKNIGELLQQEKKNINVSNIIVL